jgi:hypothetical protein
MENIPVISNVNWLGLSPDGSAVAFEVQAGGTSTKLGLRVSDVPRMIAGLLKLSQEAATVTAKGPAVQLPPEVKVTPIQARSVSRGTHQGQNLLVVDVGVMQLGFQVPPAKGGPVQ